jgi:hypothetical protein
MGAGGGRRGSVSRPNATTVSRVLHKGTRVTRSLTKLESAGYGTINVSQFCRNAWKDLPSVLKMTMNRTLGVGTHVLDLPGS